MSNYPPGVTGNEPEIAGYVERTMTVRCEEDTMALVPLRMIGDKQEQTWWHQIIAIQRHIDDQGLARPCDFIGQVDVQHDRFTYWWECPQCGFQHEGEVEDW
jgi:hypothetical protein